jgi:RimJ/RimL family protein N-acetyltransferase
VKFEIKKISPEEWSELSELAHKLAFAKVRHASHDRIDFALLAVETPSENPIGYVTVRELDHEGVYWQFGGCLDERLRGTVHILRIYEAFCAWASENCKRITTLVENTNESYLRLALRLGFEIIGVRMFKGTILVEMLKEFR